LQEKLAEVEKERDKYRKQVQLGFKHLIEILKERDELRQLFAECQQYLKDGETPAERMARYHHDIQGLLGQLGATLKERDEWKSWSRLNKNDPLREKLAASQAREQKMRNALLVAQECLSEAHGAVTENQSVTFWFDEALSTVDAALAQDLNACPNCGGPADQGHDRCYPPTAYLCSKCQPTTEDCSAVQTKG